MRLKKNKTYVSGFTLVELIIVITILAILATIAFISFQGYSSQARDSSKVSNLKNIQSGLDLQQIAIGKYPTPDGNITSGTINGVPVAQKGIIDNAIGGLIKISKVPTDPVTNDKYLYGVSQNQQEYQIGIVLESSDIAYNPFISQTFASDYSTKVVGNYKGYLTFASGSHTYVANIPSLLYNFNGTVDLLDGENVFFIMNNQKNLPYAFGSAQQNVISGNNLVKEVYGSDAILKSIDISSIKDAKTGEEKLSLVGALGNEIKNFGMNSPEEFLDIIVNNKSISTQTNGNTGGTTAPSACLGPFINSEYLTFNNGTITGYTGPNGVSVSIPCEIGGTPVTAIGVNAFLNKGLTAVTLPSSILTIGTSAFHGNSLTNIALPEGLTTLGNYAFYENELTSIIIPNSITNLGNAAFARNKLTAVTLTNSNTTLGTGIFQENLITSVSLPEGLLSIPHNIFYENKLESITIPNTVTSIGNNAFYANQLTTLTIPDSVVTIALSSFAANKLEEIKIPSNVISVGGSAFASNKLKKIHIVNENTTFGNNVFGGQDNENKGQIAYASTAQKNTYYTNTYIHIHQFPNIITLK